MTEPRLDLDGVAVLNARAREIVPPDETAGGVLAFAVQPRRAAVIPMPTNRKMEIVALNAGQTENLQAG